jgi:hypothetical protein
LPEALAWRAKPSSGNLTHGLLGLLDADFSREELGEEGVAKGSAAPGRGNVPESRGTFQELGGAFQSFLETFPF